MSAELKSEIEENDIEMIECKKKLDSLKELESEASKLSLQEIKREILFFKEKLDLLRLENKKLDHSFDLVQTEVTSIKFIKGDLHCDIFKLHKLLRRNKIKLEKLEAENAGEEIILGNERNSRKEKEISDEYKKKLERMILEMKASVHILEDMSEEAKLSGIGLKKVEIPVIAIVFSSFFIGVAVAASFR